MALSQTEMNEFFRRSLDHARARANYGVQRHKRRIERLIETDSICIEQRGQTWGGPSNLSVVEGVSQSASSLNGTSATVKADRDGRD